MSDRLPVVSGPELVGLVVPLHAELKRGTLAGILRDAHVDRDVLRRLL